MFTGVCDYQPNDEQLLKCYVYHPQEARQCIGKWRISLQTDMILSSANQGRSQGGGVIPAKTECSPAGFGTVELTDNDPVGEETVCWPI